MGLFFKIFGARGGGGGSAQAASGSDQLFKNAGVNTAVLSQVSSGSSRSADAAAVNELMKITVDSGTPYRTMSGLFDRAGALDSKSAQKRVNSALAQAKAQGAPPAAVRVLRQVGANEIRRLRAAEQADRKQERAAQAAYDARQAKKKPPKSKPVKELTDKQMQSLFTGKSRSKKTKTEDSLPFDLFK